jgi:hypothetical protein
MRIKMISTATTAATLNIANVCNLLTGLLLLTIKNNTQDTLANKMLPAKISMNNSTTTAMYI